MSHGICIAVHCENTEIIHKASFCLLQQINLFIVTNSPLSCLYCPLSTALHGKKGFLLPPVLPELPGRLSLLGGLLDTKTFPLTPVAVRAEISDHGWLIWTGWMCLLGWIKILIRFLPTPSLPCCLVFFLQMLKDLPTYPRPCLLKSWSGCSTSSLPDLIDWPMWVEFNSLLVFHGSEGLHVELGKRRT